MLWKSLAATFCAALVSGASANILPPFSWNTLPVFFHSAITDPVWSDAAAAAIARYPIATFEKNMGYSTGSFSEVNAPAACRQIAKASNGTTATVYYLNSVVDWWFYSLHAKMEAHPEWRLKDSTGKDLLVVGNTWGYNISIPEVREMWVNDCLAAVDAGCSGCYIDKSNDMGQLSSTQRMTPAQVHQFRLAHMATLDELDERLAEKGAFAIANNQGTATKARSAMMFEDFAATDHCITQLQTVVSRGLAVEVKAGHAGTNTCVNGDTNSMSAFLIGMGEHSYYHCSPTWQSSNRWPDVPDYWLDWLPEYDLPLGKPLSDGVKSNGIWRRSFSSGTKVEFDGTTGVGTIRWADGTVQTGQNLGVKNNGCQWQTM